MIFLSRIIPNLLLLSSCTICFTACYTPRYMYSPPATNVPLLEKKGDSRVAALYAAGAVGTGGQANTDFYYRGFDVQLALAVTNHATVLFNQSNRYEKNAGDFDGLIDSAVVVYKRSMTEIGGGYFARLAGGSAGMQLLGGMGAGKFTLADNGLDVNGQPYNRFYEARVIKLFFQPAFCVHPSPYFTTGFASRISVLFFNRIRTDYTTAEQTAFLLDGLEQDARVFWEPAIVNSFTFKRLKGLRFEAQVGFASLLSKRFVDYRSFNFAAGVSIDWRRLATRK